MTSPFFKISLNSFLVQVISWYSIIPFFLLCVSISIVNFLILLTIASSHPIEFSNLKFFKFFVQLFEYETFFIGPRQPFLLS